MYRVVRAFKSKGGHNYIVGDSFPHESDGKATNARVKKLSIPTNNKYGQIYIEKNEAK